jgi:two-component system, NarL family, response regulator
MHNAMDPGPIRVLCVDDHSIVREGIGLIIDREPDMQMVGFASTVDEAVDCFKRQRPDVTLMDLRLGSGGDGAIAIQRILREFSDAKIIVLTMYEGEEDIHRSMDSGAITYLLKDTLSDDLIRVVRAVYRGGRPMDPEIAARLQDRASNSILTRREIAVIELLAMGMRNKEIANSLSISEGTVQVHMRNIFAKLDVKDRTGAISVAAKRGIIHLG